MPRRSLNLGGHAIPDEAVTQTFVALGKRGSGKTTFARVLAEQLLDASLPVVVLDPTGVWWGIRSTADGKAAGYPVIIFGGDHADVPLEEKAGALIADVIVDERISAVLDLSLLSKSAARRFAIDFLERLYHRNRDPLHVIVDEADLFAPQRLPAGAERLLGAMDDLVRRGRVRGLGCTLITQRPAVLNKDVMSQAEVLVAMRMTGKRDVDAINEWVALHADEDEARTVKASLPSLPIGTAWFWSPGWLGMLERVDVQRPTTYDSSATPKPGERRAPVRTMADVDLAALGERIADAVERAKEADPKQLRARIAQLERELRDLVAGQKAKIAADPVEVRVEVPVLTDADRDELQKMRSEILDGFIAAADAAKAMGERLNELLAPVAAVPPSSRARAATPKPKPAKVESREPTRRPTQPAPTDGDVVKLSKAERKILNVLVQHGTLSTNQTAILAGYSSKTSTWRSAIGKLRSSGLATGYGAEISATPAGVRTLGPADPLPTGAALRDWWKTNHLSKAERAILDVLADAWPDPLPDSDLAARAGYDMATSTWRSAIGRLRSLELAVGYGEITISDTLMED